jgi:hypothetical protein
MHTKSFKRPSHLTYWFAAAGLDLCSCSIAVRRSFFVVQMIERCPDGHVQTFRLSAQPQTVAQRRAAAGDRTNHHLAEQTLRLGLQSARVSSTQPQCCTTTGTSSVVGSMGISMESQFWRASRACPPSCCDDDHLARSANLLHCSNHAKAKVSEADELLQSSSPNTAPRKSRQDRES